MRKIFSFILFLSIIILSFSSCKVSFNGSLKVNLEKQELELEKIQYYNSKTIILKRVVSSNETEVLSGKVTLQNGQMIEEIEIKKNTPGIMVNSSLNEMHIKFEPGNQKGNFLVFELSSDKRFVLRNQKGKVNYHDAIYRSNGESAYAELLIKKKSSRAVTYNKRKAKGVKVN
tara:strand:- start:662 stop:1180 length:519 start_codon:yes stop_codon:yes gene_type:complete